MDKQSQAKISTEVFVRAFTKLFECNIENLEVKDYIPGKSVLIIYQGDLYKVETYQGLYEDVKSMLTHIDEAEHIPLEYWIEFTQGILSSADFHIELSNTIDNDRDIPSLQLALTMSGLALNPEKTFWHALWALDNYGSLFGNAVVAAAKMFDLDVLTLDMLSRQIDNGNTFYNEEEDGIFERVFLTEEIPNNISFYVFNVHFDKWVD